MGGIPDQVLEEIRDRGDIVEIVGRHVTLRKSGHRFWGLCPFHAEKTPSFTVHPDKQIFYCFGCGVHGDVFSFRMRHEGLDFLDAVRALAAELGIQIPENGSDGGRTARLYAANEAALGYFRESLRSPVGRAGAGYLQERGLPADLIERFQLGFAPAGWDGLQLHLRARGTRLEDAEAAGLVAPRRTGDGFYDRFRERVMFPIAEPGGRIAGFGGRSLDGEPPKYMNSPETAIYRKGRVLFGLPLALEAIRKRDRAIVVEGYFDVLALHRVGLPEAVAPCGTALTTEHARRLRRYTREVILLFDGDEAGQRAAERSLPVLLGEDLRVRAVFLPVDEDPDTLVQRHGEAALRAAVEAAEPLVDVLIDRKLGFARAGAWESSEALEQVLPLIQAVPDAMQRARYIRGVASRLEVLPQVIEAELERQGVGTQRAPGEARPEMRPLSPRDSETEPVYRELLGALIAFPCLFDELSSLHGEFDFADEAWISELRVRQLLTCIADAWRRHGERCVAHLLSPSDEALPESLRTMLSALAAQSSTASGDAARRVLADCLAQLDARRLKQRQRALSDRLGSCSEPAQQDSLLEEMQQLLDEKRRRDQRQRTQALV